LTDTRVLRTKEEERREKNQ